MISGLMPERSPLARSTRAILGGLSLILGAAIWIPSVHLFFTPRDPLEIPAAADAAPEARPIPRRAKALFARQIALFHAASAKAAEATRMRATNPEWDFMGRSFLAFALADLALSDAEERPHALAVMDEIIEDTRRAEADHGLYHFLMPYAAARPFVQQPARSQFLDGELALMLGLRRLVAERDDYKAPLTDLVAVMIGRMQKSPVLSAESYPDECWTFCNTLSLAAIRVADVLDGTDHSAFLRDWVKTAREKLTDPATGLLISSYSLDGKVKDGPEGSSIWLAAHALRLIDEEFARDQYARARRELGREILGFAYAREWPLSHRGPEDVDSGPVIPLLDVSGGSSGLAFIGASSFADATFRRELGTTLDFAAFPTENHGELRYAASNQVGDAVLLYAMVLGPSWRLIQTGRRP